MPSPPAGPPTGLTCPQCGGAGYLAVQSLTAYYLLARDAEGLYVTAFARLLPAGWSLAAIQDELATAADWLRHTREAADQERRDQSA